jgi:rhamnose utilization protein RhaD (predicted bifunctional aldolase and dehydrogenase)
VDDIAALVNISRLAGERFDLVQAGGGNSSVKIDGEHIYVKASGLALSDVSSSDFCLLRYPSLIDFVESASAAAPSAPGSFDYAALAELDKLANAAVEGAQENSKRPSIEALLHCLLGKFTLHTHPIAVAALVCRSNWRDLVRREWPLALLVSYRTPGAALALELAGELKKSGWRPGDELIVFLENHGLIVAAATASAVLAITDKVTARVESLLAEDGPPLDLNRYRLTSSLSALLNQVCQTQLVSYLSDDSVLHGAVEAALPLVLARPATPDQLVYCGVVPLALEGSSESGKIDLLSETNKVEQYLRAHGQPPKVVLLDGKHLLFVGKSLRKCRDAEEVLRSHVLLQSGGTFDTMKYLDPAEVDYLSNWEAEKYRQSL